MSYFGSTEFMLEVAKGNVAGHEAVYRRGHDSNITTTLRTVGAEGVLHTYDSTAAIDTITSTSASDTHAITIEGLDINYDPVVQTATLNGQTAVTLTTPLFRVNCIHNDIGTTLTATLGTIYLWKSGGGSTGGVPNTAADVRSTIQLNGTISNEQCFNSVYTVPAGKTGYLVYGKTTVSDAKALELSFWGGIGHVAMMNTHEIDIRDNSYDYFFILPQKILEKTDLEVRATVDSGTADVAAHFDIILVDN